MRIYKCSMGFRIPAVDQSHWSIEYNYDLIHCQTIVQILHHFAAINNIEVTINTCTCKDVFTVITTKDQSGGIYNNYSTGGQGFMALVNKPCPQATCPQATPSDWAVYCHKSLAPVL